MAPVHCRQRGEKCLHSAHIVETHSGDIVETNIVDM